MATQNFINECKNRANVNRLAKFNIDNLLLNQTNHISKIELKDSCYVNDTIIGAVYTRSANVNVLNLPLNTELVGKTISPQIGVRYSDNSEEYIEFDDYIIESVNDEQTASNTEFSAMNGGALLDKEYMCTLSFENGQTHTINEFYQDACNQLGLTPTDATFDNSEIIMTGNPFQNKESIRIVLQEVERISCSIIDFDWKNHTITLKWLSDQIDYEFNTSDYSILEGSLAQYGPLNEIIIGNSQLDGENVVMRDDESIEEYGLHSIMIDAPYFLYTEELRSEAIQAIYDKLDGLTYYDLKLTTPYGKPFLNIGDKIRINTNENQVYDTYVLSHTFTYDGAFQSIIESPALTSEEQTVKNEMKNGSIKERLKRTEVIVDKTTGQISAITDRIDDVEDEFGNYYTIEQTNSLIQTAETGVTNTFSKAGGNNIFRNTGLWFENIDTSDDVGTFPSSTTYPSSETYPIGKSPYEYWTGIVLKVSEERAANRNALMLQNTIVSQSQIVPNGDYTVSFKYKKLLPLSVVKVIINDVEYELTGEGEKEFQKLIVVNSQTIKIDFSSNLADACEIYDLMVNAGEVKLAYSQNQNETTTDTVNISKGITITSSDTNTVFRANSDGVRIYATGDMEHEKTKFTDKGIYTKEIEAEDHNKISGVLIQKIGNQTWFTKI